ncbi:hypothetical protein B2J86_02335 [Acidovorax sp. SRB_14]|uniref:flagellar FliJ family protein n=1 Tax=Acidovorax sp. SRB_14 TaxID=1962699 RepID=UPI00146AF59B|nr:flagellar FliJ family protein [Acidovorax sp. SRB_14]NMM79776.1 hypothetical protein [Acidovorax sp. SRB_14]NMM84882.1 hypothetical protein [Rhodococcus sp. SRB_17]
MTNGHSLGNLARLVELRQRAVDRQLAEVADKQSVRERYQRNLEQLDSLCRNAGPSGASMAVFSLNNANYKQTVMQLADTHRVDLALHDADLALSRRALVEAARQREAVDQLLTRQRQALQRTQAAQEQKRQDDMASLVWQRRSV